MSAAALAKITKEEFYRKYEGIDARKYGFPKSAEDRDYSWEWLTGIVTFYQKAAAEGRYVLFTADQ